MGSGNSGLLFSAKGPNSVKLGALFESCDYSMGYARSARVLFEALDWSSDDVRSGVPPILYMARHAVELTLKDMLQAHHSNETDQAEIDGFDGKPTKATPLPQNVLDELNRTHDLTELLGWVQQYMPGYYEASWDDMVKTINQYEMNDPSRFRYDTVRVGKGAAAKMVASFDPSSKPIPIKKILEMVEACMKRAADTSGDNPDSIPHELSDIGFHLTQELGTRGLIY